MTDALAMRILISLLAGGSIYVLVRHGMGPLRVWLEQQHDAYDTVLNRQLMLNIPPRQVLIGKAFAVVFGGFLGAVLARNLFGGVITAVICYFLPYLIIKHYEQKRRQKLNLQLVDGLTTLASGVRAGLTLVQSMELLAQNHTGPIKQEFSQLLREYQMGVDLNQAMRNTAQRIGLPLYRLTFTAIEMHRLRGGDTGQSLDRIADSIRQIQNVEGKLDALTAQGRTQAWMMAVMPVVFLIILYLAMPNEVSLLFTDPIGRLVLLGVAVVIGIAFMWIRKIMAVDI